MHGLDLFIVFALISAYSPAPGGGSRAGGIRTHDLLHPKQARYQTALYPAKKRESRRRGTGGDPARSTERVTGIEPAPSAWKAEALPLSYTRMREPTAPAR